MGLHGIIEKAASGHSLVGIWPGVKSTRTKKASDIKAFLSGSIYTLELSVV